MKCRQPAAAWWMILIGASLMLAIPSSFADEEDARTFVDSIAAATYACAWPTATYEKVAFKTVDYIDDRYEAIFRLSGKSGLDGSDLWVDLAFQFRRGAFERMRVVNHNAFWVPPFKTCEAIGQIVVTAMEESDPPSRHVASPPSSSRPASSSNVAAVCIQNTANFSVRYAYRWGEGSWAQGTVDSQAAMQHWWTDGSSSPFEVSFDDKLSDGVTESRRTLGLSRTATPIDCSSVRSYSFVVDDGAIGLRSDTWQAGWPHPFAPSVVAATEEGRWLPAEGYRWFDPADLGTLEVVPADLGIVGLRLQRVEDSPYPIVGSVVSTGPASTAGVRPGMDILRVDGVSTAGKSLDECAGLLSGPKGELITVNVREPGASSTRNLVIRRQ